MNALKRFKSPCTRALMSPKKSPAFSTKPSGSYSIWSMMRVRWSSSRWNVTTPRVPRARRAVPGYARVRDLLRDRRFPRLLLAADLGAPVQPAVVELADFPHAFHEARKLLELGPLVVRGANRNRDVDRLLDKRGHRTSF